MNSLDSIFQRAVQGRITPGGVLRVGNLESCLLERAFGRTAEGQDGGRDVVVTDVYDTASVTKAVVTSALTMKLVDEGTISLDARAIEFLPQVRMTGREGITLRHLVGHASGLPDHQLFYERIWAGDLAGQSDAREALLHMVGNTELAYPTGTRTLYSDLGYMLLGRALEAASGTRLDELFRERVAEPLGMDDSFFVDLSAPRREDPRIVPTENCPRRGLVRGEVHDENAHAGQGIWGHAGLFSTAVDLARFAVAMCSSFIGKSDFLRPQTVREFWTTTAAPETSWVLGWDRPDPRPGISHAGERWPRDGVGHLGFTGTCLWLDPVAGRHVVLLTNRVYYSRDKERIKGLRRAVMDEVVDSVLL